MAPKAPLPLKPPRAELPTARGIALSTSLVTDHTPGFLVGGGSHVARAFAAESLMRWRFAYVARQLYPRSAAAMKLAKLAGSRLLSDLERALAKADGPLKEALKRDIADLDQTLKSITTPPLAGAAVAPRLSELARLEQAAISGSFAGGDALRAAFRRWREATTSYDLADLDGAGAALLKAIDQSITREMRKAGKFRPPSYYRARVEAAIRTLSRSKPSEQATEAFRVLEDQVRKDPALMKIWQEQIRPAVARAPHTWDKLANVLSGIKQLDASDTAAIEAAVDRVKGVFGEMASLSVPAYRDALTEATRNADQLAAAANRQALRAAQKAGTAADFKPPYRVLFPQFDIRAPGATGKGLRLYFDDAVLVVNDAATPPEAFVLFAAQVKAGDASTAGAVEQMIEDQARLLKGRIAVGPTEYVLRPPPDIGAVTRVFVGTKTPPGAAALSGRIRLVKGPADGITLAQFAELALKAAGKIK
jgi:hypothetical protein